jgi:hypothetical protein
MEDDKAMYWIELPFQDSSSKGKAVGVMFAPFRPRQPMTKKEVDEMSILCA